MNHSITFMGAVSSVSELVIPPNAQTCPAIALDKARSGDGLCYVFVFDPVIGAWPNNSVILANRT